MLINDKNVKEYAGPRGNYLGNRSIPRGGYIDICSSHCDKLANIPSSNMIFAQLDC